MADLKPISSAGVPAALEKADRYRLLNEPELAESICLDILNVEPENQKALALLILSRTDQFKDGNPQPVARAREVLPKLNDPYETEYFGGLICEAQGRSLLGRRGQHSNHVAYEMFHFAMEHYEKAIALRQEGVPDAVLRWNTCVRLIERHDLTAPPVDDVRDHALE
jgi:hypothetical protein